MNFFSRIKLSDTILKGLLVCVLGVCCLIFGLHLIDDEDFLWHLKTGELILRQGPPQVDFYSFRAQGREWIDAQWLFQVIIYLVYRFFGFKGESWFLGLLATSIFLVLYRLVWDKNLYPVGFFFLLISLWVTSLRFNLRPELFSYLLMVSYWLILEQSRKKNSNYLFLLPPLQLLWANLEGLWPIGLVIIGAYLAEEFLNKFGSQSKFLARWLGPFNQSRLEKIFLVFVICTFASLLTPYHLRGFIFPFKLLLEVTHPSNFVKSHILDSRPVFPLWLRFPFLTGPLLFLIFASLASFFFNLKPRISHIILYFPFLFISLSARRNIPFICLLSVFVIMTNFQVWFYSRVPNFPYRLTLRLKLGGIIVGFGVTLFLILGIVSGKFYKWDKTGRKFGTGFNFEKYPVEAVNFLKSIGWKGKLYNQLETGGLLIWTLYPEVTIYVDGRLEVYGDKLLQEGYESMLDYDRFQIEKWKYGFDAILLDTRQNLVVPMANELVYEPNWALVYSDPISLVFLEDNPRQHHLVEKYRQNRILSPGTR